MAAAPIARPWTLCSRDESLGEESASAAHPGFSRRAVRRGVRCPQPERPPGRRLLSRKWTACRRSLVGMASTLRVGSQAELGGRIGSGCAHWLASAAMPSAAQIRPPPKLWRDLRCPKTFSPMDATSRSQGRSPRQSTTPPRPGRCRSRPPTAHPTYSCSLPTTSGSDIWSRSGDSSRCQA